VPILLKSSIKGLQRGNIDSIVISKIGTGYSCPNNPLNMYAFMHKKLPKCARKKFKTNVEINFTLF
jgi:hypothetical protein